MKMLIVFLAQVPAVLCLAIAGYMAVANVQDWGFFLFAGLLLGLKSLRYSDDSDSDSEAKPSIEHTA